MFRRKQKSRLASVVALFSVCLSGCSGWQNVLKAPDEEAVVVTGPTPHRNQTPMAQALACLHSAVPSSRNFRIGVSELVDGTGAIEGGSQNGRVFSQRPDYMMIVGLKSAGVDLVNRSSVNVAEWEMAKAMEQKLGDGHKVMMDQTAVAFRPISAGQILGSNYYLTGAVTELNWNIDSKVAEASVYGIGAGARTYRISIAVDVMVTNTLSTQVVHARSYKKQLFGYETNAGAFRFIENNQLLAYGLQGALMTKALQTFEANIGDKQNEPTQTALRWVIELAAYDVVRSITKRGAECDSLLPPGSIDLEIPGGGIGPGPDNSRIASNADHSGSRIADAKKPTQVGAAESGKPAVQKNAAVEPVANAVEQETSVPLATPVPEAAKTAAPAAATKPGKSVVDRGAGASTQSASAPVSSVVVAGIPNPPARAEKETLRLAGVDPAQNALPQATSSLHSGTVDAGVSSTPPAEPDVVSSADSAENPGALLRPLVQLMFNPGTAIDAPNETLGK